MSRLVLAGTTIAVFVSMLSGCGASHKQHAGRTRAVASGPVVTPASSDEVLSLSGLGTFEGRCPRGAHRWTLRFVVTAEATDTLSYRVGTAARRTVNVDPGSAIAINLVPNAARTHEPADGFVPPVGQGRGVATAMSVPTTARLQAVIYQGTEPQTLQADVDLALSTLGGESGQCVLVGTSVNAYTYPNG
jgi:hypothetical protein